MKTTVISIMSQKGGVGKSTITNSVVLDWSFKYLLRNKKMPKLLLIDADAQTSISKQRKEDMALCGLDLAGKEFGQLDATTQVAAKEMRTQFEALYQEKQWRYYPIKTIDVDDDGSSLAQAIALIESNEYEYVFVDMPGTLHQANTSTLFLCINYLIIPTAIGGYDLRSALDFYKQISNPNLLKETEIKSVCWVFNKYDVIRANKYDEVERELVLATRVPFFKTRIKNSSFFPSRAYNSIVPPTYRMNLNTLEVTATPKITNIGQFTDELQQLLTSDEASNK
jgi:chromosome partitioning protein